MFKTTFIFSLLLTSSVCFSQKIYFAKDNYQDSNLLQTNIVGLAKQAIPLYKNDDQEKYLDNLFRLQLTANMYQETLSSLNALMHFYYGDSITPSVMGIAFQLYSATMKIDPPTHTFEEAYSKVFYDKYNSFNDYNKSLTIQYFVTPIETLQKRLLAVIGEYQNKDSLSVYEAARLCRAYLGYKVYGKTQKIALKILNDIDHQKFVIEDSILLKMPDGGTVSLAIVRNRKDTAPLPVVLMYNIYAGSEVADCKVAATRGYVGIVANTRGKRLSQDVIEPFENDAKDAYYIIDWISKQPWCNGKIGMYGGSYLGFSQWSATKKLHPALTTIVPQVSVGIGIDFPMHNNIFMSYMLRWIHNVTDIKLTDDIGFMDRSKWLSLYNQWYKSGRRFRSLDTLEGRGNTIFQRWLQHPSYDAYWQSMTPQKEAYANINIPILSITGYWDDDQTGALYYYRQHHQWNKNPHHYLLIGPYNHTGAQDYPNPVLYGYTIDSVANIPIIDLVYDWFGHTLKNGQRPAILKDKVNFQIMGKNEWRSVPTLSRMADDTLRLYLTNTRINKRYRLGITQPGAMGFVSQTIDFKDRSDSNTVELAEATDAFSIIEDSAKVITKDHLVFVSDPVEKPMAISGAILPTLLASINKRDMDFFVSLYEQTPDGKYVWLGKNAQRASYANDRTKRQLLTPYKIERLPITNTYMTCKQLQKGSRIVVVVGINKNRYWQINYGTGKDVSDETVADAGVPLQVKWHHGSCIEIPVLRR